MGSLFNAKGARVVPLQRWQRPHGRREVYAPPACESAMFFAEARLSVR
ncbi:MAG TPA: hypothetical protein VN680_06990 [Burkholderiaceae bacterium]|jgi:hypothetical protein|nr:hypothetical protein [Burkholderiaceae bacterium]